ncbi:MAG: hypothetical protein RR361_07940, partial [Anaerovorax sp.]
GLVREGNGLKAVEGIGEEKLKAQYGTKLAAVFSGEIYHDVEKHQFIFTGDGARLSPNLTASWAAGDGGLTVHENGRIDLSRVSLSTPTFKFFMPRERGASGLSFDFSNNGFAVKIDPTKNAAILHIEIPGATSKVEQVIVQPDNSLIFQGEMSLKTPLMDAANLSLKQMGMGWEGEKFGLTGVEASGKVDMSQLLGMDVANVSADINTFKGQQRYAFDLHVNFFDLFGADADLDLREMSNGELIPDSLHFFLEGEPGIPLVNPAPVVLLKGGGGGFSGLAATADGNYFGLPPMQISISAKVSIVGAMDGKATVTVGAGYYALKAEDIKLMEYIEFADELSLYTNVNWEQRQYGGQTYDGVTMGGGINIDARVPYFLPIIHAGGQVDLAAFGGYNP